MVALQTAEEQITETWNCNDYISEYSLTRSGQRSDGSAPSGRCHPAGAQSTPLCFSQFHPVLLSNETRRWRENLWALVRFR